MTEDVRETVRSRYAHAATTVLESHGVCGCGDSECCGSGTGAFGMGLYEGVAPGNLPEGALMASLGCGNPTAVAALHEGETVLDLGSGGGIDVLLSARRVGPTGKVYGLDMTEEMLELAVRNREEAGLTNVEFLKGYIEEIPLPRATVDVVISNCVINLSADKARVFAEMFRVLRPGGRIGVSDVVASNDLSPEDRAERGTFVGCIAGALSFEEYERGLAQAGFEEISIASTHEVADGMFGAIITAHKGTVVTPARPHEPASELPIVRAGCC